MSDQRDLNEARNATHQTITEAVKLARSPSANAIFSGADSNGSQTGGASATTILGSSGGSPITVRQWVMGYDKLDDPEVVLA